MRPQPISPETNPSGSSQNLFYIGLGAFTLLLASLPYLLGALSTPNGSIYSGLAYNIDDTAVYLSWMRQVVDGAFFQKNLFAVEEQKGVVLNLFGLLLGATAKLLGENLIAAYHFWRVVFGGLLLWAVASLIEETITEPRARKWAFAFTCLASGLGWLLGGYDPAKAWSQPVDLNQPEAITFLSVYYTPLFTAAQALMVVFMEAVLRVERTGKGTAAVPAMVASALLANFHTYDIIPLFVFWTVFRGVQDLRKKGLTPSLWLAVVLTGLATLPTAGYQYYALILDPIFKLRDVGTPTSAPIWVLLGLGLPLLLALVAAFARGEVSPLQDSESRVLLTVWMGTHLACAYLPVDFQRKLLMGVHLPVCLLAGVALYRLTAKLSGKMPLIVGFVTVLFCLPTNALFLLQDSTRLEANVSSTDVQPYLKQTEVEALNWLRKNAKRTEIVFCAPDPTSHRRFPFLPLKPYLALYVPAWTGNPVYNGHISETPRWSGKIREMVEFFDARTPDTWRETFLREKQIRYILVPNGLAGEVPPFPNGIPLQINGTPYTAIRFGEDARSLSLKSEFRNTDVTVYGVSQL